MRSLLPSLSPLLTLARNRKKPVARHVDPTRTTLLQRHFAEAIQFRFARLSAVVLKTVGKDNAFDLVERKKLTKNELALNGPYQFATDASKQKAFMAWLQTQLDQGVLGISDANPGDPFTMPYITSAYRQGLVRAYVDTHKADLPTDPDFYEQTQAQFLTDSFAAAVAQDRVEMLATRAFEEMKGLTSYEKTQLNRLLADAMANGLGAMETARSMVDQIDVTRSRANTIARTEIVRAHAEGQLFSFRRMGVDRLGIEVEWLTADDDTVCEDCQDGADGGPYTIDEAQGMIPMHPNCRCAWVADKNSIREAAQEEEPEPEQPEEEAAAGDEGGDDGDDADTNPE